MGSITELRSFKMIRQCLATLTLSATALCAAAQPFPNKPVSLVVPYAAGGLTDNIARYFSAQLKDVWSQPVVVENKPGAGASIGAAQVARANPDGYSLLLGSVGMVTNPFMFKNLPYKPSDLAPLALVAMAPNVLYVHASVPANNVAELVAYARKNPGALTFASSGIGSSPHLAAELFAARAGIEIVHVPYKGTGAAINDFLGGQVKAYFDTMQSMPYVKEGKIKALAVTTEKRLANAPDLPTVEESGVASGVISSSWFGFFTQEQVPQARRTEISDALLKIAGDPAAQEKMRAFDLVPVQVGARDFGQFLEAESKRWGGLIKAQNITVE